MTNRPLSLCFFLILAFFTFSGSNAAFADKTPGDIAAWYMDYDVKFYKIDIEANDTAEYIKGNTMLLCEVKTERLDTFKVELSSALTMDSITINNSKIRYLRAGDLVKAILPSGKKRGQMISVTIYYQGMPLENGFFSPLTSRLDGSWKIPVTWTLSEPLGAKNWFPCKQHLPDKADSAWIFVTVPKHCKAGANGLLTAVCPLGNHTRYEWKTKYPVAYYLLSFTVSDYQDYSFYAKLNDNDSVLVQNYLYNRPNCFENNKSLIDATGDLLRYYSSVYGKYPFSAEKYGHCMAPIGGGMEHQTMTTLSNFDYSLVSHELAHQWFGNWVTCASWQHIWVNEGFASYSEYLALERMQSREEAQDWIRSAHNSAFREPHGAVFVAKKDMENDLRIFNYNLSYKKGASIIHILRYELANDSLFFKILPAFLDKYKDSVATAEDFIEVVNHFSGGNYHWFLQQWYYGKGFPIIDISWNQTKDSVIIVSNQTTSDRDVPFFKMHFDFKLRYQRGGDTIIRLYQDQPQKTFKIAVKKRVGQVDIDPQEWLLCKAKADKVTELPTFDDYFRVSPVPFSSELNIQFKSEPITKREVKLLDASGNTVYQFNPQKKTEAAINTADFAAGIYLLCITDGGAKYTRKITKAR